MIEKEITYERGIHKSYMKISAVPEGSFDEKVMLKREIAGLLSVEKCYINGEGQYWYNISGQQALDRVCKIEGVEPAFFERLILRICDQIELLEWNLLDVNCLVMEPEYIFVNTSGEDISFLFYPQKEGEFVEQLQQLLEFLLTKLNHRDNVAIQVVYEIYEMVLEKDFQILEWRNRILESRIKKEEPIQVETVKEDRDEHVISEHKEEEIDVKSPIETKLFLLYKKAKELLRSRPSDFAWQKILPKEEMPVVVYPDEPVVEERLVENVHPTVCLSNMAGGARGLLLYEGQGEYRDLEIKKEECIVGKNAKVDIKIDKETISQFHAKIENKNGGYYIEDLNSTNGTYVNDTILNYKENRLLEVGDIIRFADVRYRFV